MDGIDYLRYPKSFDFSKVKIIDNDQTLNLPQKYDINNWIDELRVRDFMKNEPEPRTIQSLNEIEKNRLARFGMKVDISPERIFEKLSGVTLKLPRFNNEGEILRDEHGRDIMQMMTFGEVLKDKDAMIYRLKELISKMGFAGGFVMPEPEHKAPPSPNLYKQLLLGPLASSESGSSWHPMSPQLTPTTQALSPSQALQYKVLHQAMGMPRVQPQISTPPPPIQQYSVGVQAVPSTSIAQVQAEFKDPEAIKTINTLQGQISGLQTTQAESESKHQDAVESLNDQLSNLQTTHDERKRKDKQSLDMLRNKLQGLKSNTLTVQQQTISDLNDQLNGLQDAQNKTDEAHQHVVSSLNDRISDLQTIQNDANDAHQQALDALNAQLSDVKSAHAIAGSAHQDTLRELRQTLSLRGEDQKSIMEAETRYNELRAERDNDLTMIKECQEKIALKESISENEQKERALLSNELNALKRLNEEATLQKENLSRQLEREKQLKEEEKAIKESALRDLEIEKQRKEDAKRMQALAEEGLRQLRLATEIERQQMISDRAGEAKEEEAREKERQEAATRRVQERDAQTERYNVLRDVYGALRIEKEKSDKRVDEATQKLREIRKEKGIIEQERRALYDEIQRLKKQKPQLQSQSTQTRPPLSGHPQVPRVFAQALPFIPLPSTGGPPALPSIMRRESRADSPELEVTHDPSLTVPEAAEVKRISNKFIETFDEKEQKDDATIKDAHKLARSVLLIRKKIKQRKAKVYISNDDIIRNRKRVEKISKEKKGFIGTMMSPKVSSDASLWDTGLPNNAQIIDNAYLKQFSSQDARLIVYYTVSVGLKYSEATRPFRDHLSSHYVFNKIWNSPNNYIKIKAKNSLAEDDAYIHFHDKYNISFFTGITSPTIYDYMESLHGYSHQDVDDIMLAGPTILDTPKVPTSGVPMHLPLKLHIYCYYKFGFFDEDGFRTPNEELRVSAPATKLYKMLAKSWPQQGLTYNKFLLMLNELPDNWLTSDETKDYDEEMKDYSSAVSAFPAERTKIMMDETFDLIEQKEQQLAEIEEKKTYEEIEFKNENDKAKALGYIQARKSTVRQRFIILMKVQRGMEYTYEDLYRDRRKHLGSLKNVWVRKKSKYETGLPSNPSFIDRGYLSRFTVEERAKIIRYVMLWGVYWKNEYREGFVNVRGHSILRRMIMNSKARVYQESDRERAKKTYIQITKNGDMRIRTPYDIVKSPVSRTRIGRLFKLDSQQTRKLLRKWVPGTDYVTKFPKRLTLEYTIPLVAYIRNKYQYFDHYTPSDMWDIIVPNVRYLIKFITEIRGYDSDMSYEKFFLMYDSIPQEAFDKIKTDGLEALVPHLASTSQFTEARTKYMMDNIDFELITKSITKPSRPKPKPKSKPKYDPKPRPSPEEPSQAVPSIIVEPSIIAEPIIEAKEPETETKEPETETKESETKEEPKAKSPSPKLEVTHAPDSDSAELKRLSRRFLDSFPELERIEEETVNESHDLAKGVVKRRNKFRWDYNDAFGTDEEHMQSSEGNAKNMRQVIAKTKGTAKWKKKKVGFWASRSSKVNTEKAPWDVGLPDNPKIIDSAYFKQFETPDSKSIFLYLYKIGRNRVLNPNYYSTFDRFFVLESIRKRIYASKPYSEIKSPQNPLRNEAYLILHSDHASDGIEFRCGLKNPTVHDIGRNLYGIANNAEVDRILASGDDEVNLIKASPDLLLNFFILAKSHCFSPNQRCLYPGRVHRLVRTINHYYSFLKRTNAKAWVKGRITRNKFLLMLMDFPLRRSSKRPHQQATSYKDVEDVKDETLKKIATDVCETDTKRTNIAIDEVFNPKKKVKQKKETDKKESKDKEQDDEDETEDKKEEKQDQEPPKQTPRTPPSTPPKKKKGHFRPDAHDEIMKMLAEDAAAEETHSMSKFQSQQKGLKPKAAKKKPFKSKHMEAFKSFVEETYAEPEDDSKKKSTHDETMKILTEDAAAEKTKKKKLSKLEHMDKFRRYVQEVLDKPDETVVPKEEFARPKAPKRRKRTKKPLPGTKKLSKLEHMDKFRRYVQEVLDEPDEIVKPKPKPEKKTQYETPADYLARKAEETKEPQLTKFQQLQQMALKSEAAKKSKKKGSKMTRFQQLQQMALKSEGAKKKKSSTLARIKQMKAEESVKPKELPTSALISRPKAPKKKKRKKKKKFDI